MATIRDLLKGMTPGRLQTVGRMQVIPLIVPDDGLHDDRFTPPVSGAAKFATTGYGTMSFENTTDKILLVPSHAGYMVKESAQNHAMTSAGMVKKKASRQFDNARCIQQRQGGYIRPGDHADEMIILPYTLREPALDGRKHVGYDRLWGAIATFNREMGVEYVGEIDRFLQHYAKQLDEFVAEFETVSNQCGAIVLVDGEVVGFERSPSPDYWNAIWQRLIRECYGLLVLYSERSNKDVPDTRVRLSMEGIADLDDLLARIDSAKNREEQRVREIIGDLLDEEFGEVTDERFDGNDDLVIRTYANTQFKGQAVVDGMKFPYASLFTTKKWHTAGPWKRAKKFAL